MFKKSIIVAIKANGKVLSEGKNGEVSLPFGTEYSLLVKNQSEFSGIVSIHIDGDTIFNPSSYEFVMAAGSTIEFSRPELNDNAFKFIEKNKHVEQYRGSRLSDGIIRVKFTTFDRPMKRDSFPIHEPVPMFPGVGVSPIFDQVFKGPSVYDMGPTSVVGMTKSSESLTEMALNLDTDTFAETNSIVIGEDKSKTHIFDKILDKGLGELSKCLGDTPRSGITTHGKPTGKPFPQRGNLQFSMAKGEEIDFIFRLKEGELVLSQDKKVCPLCKHKFKLSYTYCPYDSSYLTKIKD